MENQIKIKFSPTDTIYFIDMVEVPTYRECPDCLGEGKLLRKDNSSITCPKCKGEGKYTNSGALNHVVKQDVIVKMFIEVTEEFVDVVEYKLKEKGVFHGTIYETKEEAVKNIPHCFCGYSTT